ncbi:MAG: polyprenyl synthetase family protein [Alphaproteobacteria bacterium]|nr:polyprenyl synthetase family protein [Alphaproteobacteria bacterium]
MTSPSSPAPRAPIEPALAETAQLMERTLDALLPEPGGPEKQLIEAMRYASLGGGKRIRAFLALQAGRLFGVDRRALARAAAAVECVHAYSLVHDDLPAMDDDDMRRGKPSVHKAFDEATAILAGDALQAFAFALLANPETHADPYVRCELVAKLAAAVGANGMVGGQMIDLMSEGEEIDMATLTRLQRLKTGALIAFACDAGAIMGKASATLRHALHGYAQDLGLAFQIADDLLDAEGDPIALGKATRKDEGRGKATFIAALGVERAKAQAGLLAEQAVRHLEVFDEKADLLRAVAHWTVRRRK